MFEILERKIIGGIIKINNGTATPLESGVPTLLNKLKNIDEPCYDELLEKYKLAFANYREKIQGTK